jgi:hypothetical protein
MCVACGKSPYRLGKKTCQKCCDKHTAMHAARRLKAIDSGLCGTCRKRPLVLGIKQCKQCARKNNEKSLQRGAALVAAGLCRECGKVRVDRPKRTCVRCRKRAFDKYQALKNEVYAAYGGYLCACCHETEPAFLSLDHRNDDGAAHRREIGDGTVMLCWIKRNGFPPIFQVLCMNCQWGKRKYSQCPHQAGK